ncbi:MAG: DNA cytosine methyltransferase [Pseudomonadota bacterium]
MRYGSVCSGIEAATQAWHPLGWTPAFFSEIEPFPCAVLAHHYGSNLPGERLATNGVPNLGDMSEFRKWDDYAIDLLVGGTPCQDYSIAGQRLGMAGARGQLTLTFVEILGRYRPRWFTWENVPGVLSSNKGRDFARFLGDLTGQRIDVPGTGWQNSGIVSGIGDAYGLAWRVLDAQFTRTCLVPRAVPQRRRRVFVVGYLGDWRAAAAVLFDGESLHRNPPPRRQAGQGAAPTISARTQGGGGLGTDFELDGGLVTSTLDASFARLQGVSGQDMNHGHSHLVPVASPLTAGMAKSAARVPHEQGALVPVAFSSKDYGADAEVNLSPTLRAGGHSTSHQNAGVPPAIAFAENSRAELRLTGGDGAVAPQLSAGGGKPGQGTPAVAIQERAVSENPEAGPDGAGVRHDGAAYTLEARTVPQAVAFDLRGREGGAQAEGPHDTANIRASDGGSSRSYVAENWAVRRLTPMECERLQGFPDNFTRIEWRGKPVESCPDGPRYKALGNSMAVNVMHWLGERIDHVDKLINKEKC